MGGFRFRNGQKRLTGSEKKLAQGLGWFSVALAGTEVFAPRVLARFIGVRPKPLLLPLLGLRELASGVGLLSGKATAAWLWSRVAGDVMDLSLLGGALRSNKTNKSSVQAATAAVLGVTALDAVAAVRHSRGAFGGEINTRKAVALNRPASELYSFWHNFENLPRIMHYLEAVEPRGGNRWHWIAKAPGGTRVEWDAEVTADRADQFISWRSLPGSDVNHYGTVRFDPAPGGRGTIVRVNLTYRLPGGKVGAAIAKLFGRNPEQEIQLDLYRFKQIMETGQITTTEGQPAGRSRSTSILYDAGTTRG